VRRRSRWRLYERYGREIYARAAADPAFSEANAALVAEIRRMQREEPRAKRLGKGQALNAFLLGYAHALLMELLDAAVRTDDGPGGPSSPADDGTWAAIRLGAMFQMAFDGGLLKLAPPAADAS
jgi:hypothetical protein